MSRFCVFGSLNMDLITRVPRFVEAGETLRGLSFAIHPGGKGGNQAVALARLGATVEFVGALGDDELGRRYLEILRGLGIGLGGLRVIRGASTGSAAIEVAEGGENRIVIVPGANGALGPAEALAARALIAAADCLLLQLELPLEAVLAAARIAREAGHRVILDPAPAVELPPELYPLCSIITPNETEARILTGVAVEDDAGAARAARILLDRGVGAVVIKAGSRGAYYAEGDRFGRVPGFAVRSLDTVAAGDAFNAGLALSEGQTLPEALLFANAVGALSTTKPGAQDALPTRAEAESLLRSGPRGA